MRGTLGESAPSNATVYNWVAEFKRGRTSTTDDPRPGRPCEATTEDVEKIRNLILDDRRMKVRELAEAVHISTERVWNIIHQKLHMKKLTARWVPRLLTPDQKRNRVQTSQLCLDMFNKNPNEFFRRFVTVDETWVHFYTPETKEQSKQWIGPGERAPKKAKTVLSAGKVMATVFWDARGIILIDYLEKGKTITGTYYASLLDQLIEKIKEKRPHMTKKKVLFLQDNAPSHTSAVATAKLVQLKFEMVPHPPYSPDLSPSDYFLFPNMKKWLGGKRFTSNSEIIEAVNSYFEDFDSSYFLQGMQMIETRWTKCITLKGDYVEK